MKLLLDSANIKDIRKYMRTTAVAGVTTNPSLMAKEEKGDYLDKITQLVSEIRPHSTSTSPKHLSVEVTTLDPREMINQARKLQGVGDYLDFCVKIPCNQLEVISYLNQEGFKVNATACMTALQAKLAADAGAWVVSFFYNRIADHGNDPSRHDLEYYETDPRIVLDDFRKLCPNDRIICGSIRKPQDVFDAWVHGANYVTAGPKIIEEMMKHPQTDKALKQFQEDIDRWQG